MPLAVPYTPTKNAGRGPRTKRAATRGYCLRRKPDQLTRRWLRRQPARRPTSGLIPPARGSRDLELVNGAASTASGLALAQRPLVHEMAVLVVDVDPRAVEVVCEVPRALPVNRHPPPQHEVACDGGHLATLPSSRHRSTRNAAVVAATPVAELVIHDVANVGTSLASAQVRQPEAERERR